jgi:hypothetical protein
MLITTKLGILSVLKKKRIDFEVQFGLKLKIKAGFSYTNQTYKCILLIALSLQNLPDAIWARKKYSSFIN